MIIESTGTWLRGIFATFILRAAKPIPGYIENPQTAIEHLRNVRLERGLFQKDVAQIIGVQTETIERWEMRVSSPKPTNYPAIIKFLGYFPDCCHGVAQLKSEVFLRRVQLGISQKRLAEQIGIDTTTLHNIETDGRNIGKNTTEKVVSFIGDISKSAIK